MDPFNYAYNTSAPFRLTMRMVRCIITRKKGSSSTAIGGKSLYNYNILNELAKHGKRKWNPNMGCHGRFTMGDIAGIELSRIVLFTLPLQQTQSNMPGNVLFTSLVFEGTSTGVAPNGK